MKGDPHAEWQLDSSDADSSESDSLSDDSSDSSSEEGEGLMDPEEQARILLEADVDEEPGTGEGTILRTKNESAEKYEKPNIVVTPDMKVTELGIVETIVDNLVLIKANTSGEYQVLESGSVVCLEDRSVVGVVGETLGRVQEPRYSIGFPEASDITAAGIKKGTTIYYVDKHSKYVFTQPLKGMKYTDASNINDEEVGGHDVEFSDDEAEAEYKRNLKQAKKAKYESRREPRQDDYQEERGVPPLAITQSQNQNGGLDYSDDDEDMGMYKPLARPEHFEDIVGAGAPIEDRSHVRRGGGPKFNRGRGDRGRGNRGRGGVGGRGDRGNR
ncbi:NAF1-domain-containing protein, partial [Lepidopterella palustris CBS 459.81]